MARQKIPSTPALRFLRAAGVTFQCHPYRYKEGGGALLAARELGVEPGLVIKTLVMEDERARPLVVLMPATAEVSTKALARHIGVKSITPCRPEVANRHSGYLTGGTSPFATRRQMPVYLEHAVNDLPTVYINGGSKGLLVSLATADLLRLLEPISVKVGK